MHLFIHMLILLFFSLLFLTPMQILEGLWHPFAITVFEDTLYWTDWRDRSIEKVDKRNGQGHSTLQDRLSFPMDIRRCVGQLFLFHLS